MQPDPQRSGEHEQDDAHHGINDAHSQNSDRDHVEMREGRGWSICARHVFKEFYAHPHLVLGDALHAVQVEDDVGAGSQTRIETSRNCRRPE